MRYIISRLVVALLAIVAAVPLVRAANLSGSYTLTGGAAPVKFEAKPSLQEALKDVAVGSIVKLELNGGDFTTNDWNWLSENSETLSALTDLTLATTLAKVDPMPGINNGYCPFKFPTLKRLFIAKVVTVPANPFPRNGSLEEVTFLDATEMAEFAFAGQGNSPSMDGFTGLKTMCFPKMAKIGTQAFAKCSGLETLKLGAVPPTAVDADLWKEQVSPEAMLELVTPDGKPLEGEAKTKAEKAYLAVDDGNTSDKRWYAFALEAEEFYQVMVLGTEEGKGKVSAIPTGSVTQNTEVCLNIQPANKFMVDVNSIKAHKTGESSVEVQIDKKSYCFRMPAHNVTAEVKFVPNKLKMRFTLDKDHQSKAIDVEGEDFAGIHGKILKDKLIADGLPTVHTVEVLEGAFLADDYVKFYEFRENVPNYAGGFNNGYNGLRIFRVKDEVVNHELHMDVTGSKLHPRITEAYLAKLRTVPHSGLRSLSFLTKLELPHTLELGAEAVSLCKALSQVNLPLVTRVGDKCFDDCENLLSATLPHATEIGMGAFAKCKMLFSLQLGSVPPKVLSGAFDECPSMRLLVPVDETGMPLKGNEREKAVKAYDDAPDGMIGDGLWYGWKLPKADVHTITVDATISGGSVHAGQYGAEGQAVQVVVRPDDGKGIMELYYTEKGSTEKHVIMNNEFSMPKADITIHAVFAASTIKVKVNGAKEGEGETLTKALAAAGFGDDKEKEVKSIAIVGGSFHEKDWTSLPLALYTDGSEGLANLKEFSIESTVSYLVQMPLTLDPPSQYFKEAAVETASIAQITQTSDKAFSEAMALKKISLPDVTQMGKATFAGSKHLLEVVAPKLVQIGSSTFEGCTALKEMDLLNITSSGDYTFKGCSSLVKFGLPKVTSLGAGTFDGCTSLTTVEFPAVTISSVETFKGCTALTEAKFPVLQNVPSNMFEGCKALATVEIPAATKVEEKAFAGATSLATLRLPKVTEIGNSAFKGCTALTTIHVPMLTAVDAEAFAGCSALKTMELPALPPEDVDDEAFKDCPSSRTLVLLDASGNRLTGAELQAAVAAYRAAEDGNTSDNLWYGWILPKEGTFMVTFNVTMNGNPLPGAAVTVMANDATKKKVGEGVTDGTGVFALPLEAGKYLYTITEEHCKDLNGTFEVKDADMPMPMAMEPKAPMPEHTLTYAQPANGALLVSSDAKGTKEIATGSKVAEETKVYVTVTPSDGYEVATLTVAGKPIAITLDKEGIARASFAMPASDAEIVATLRAKSQKPEHTLTYAQPENGVLKVSRDAEGLQEVATGSKIAEETMVYVTVAPSAGYEVATITLAGKAAEVTPDKDGICKASFTMPAADAEIAATMKEMPKKPEHTLTYAQPENGMLKVSSDAEGTKEIATGSKVAEGMMVYVTVTPNAGYAVVSITLAGKAAEVTPDKDGVCKASFAMPAADAEISATMKQQAKPEPQPQPKPEPKPQPNPPSKTDVESSLLAGVTVGPNPCADVLRVLEAEQVARYAVLNLAGQVLQSGSNTQSTIEIQMQSSPAGLYVLRLTAHDGGVRVVRIVKL